MTVSPAALVDLPEDGVLTPQALARTYDSRSYADPFDAIEDYLCVRKAAAGREIGSAALARKLELPRGRIRPWLDGSAPDPARAVAIGSRNGWFESDEDTTRAWAVLLAGIYAGGSINQMGYVPSWTTEPRQAADEIRAALDRLGCESRVKERREGRADELLPTEHASPLGRGLAALGAPVGDKSSEAVDPLPRWLLDSMESVRRAAVRVLVLYRGTGFERKDTIQLQEGRSQAYRESLAGLIRSVVDGEVTAGERTVIISAAAARELGLGRGSVFRDAIES